MARHKISKSKLCSMTGIARTTLDAILNGSDAKISTIEAIATAIGVKISFLFDEEITEIREAGRDYVEKGNIEHKGTEYNGPTSVDCDLASENTELRRKLIDAQDKIIKLMEEKH